MHITDFLNQVDKLAASMTKAQLVEFVHCQARKLPESMRSDFLKELSGDTDSSRSKSKEAGLAKSSPEDLIEDVYRDLERIRNGEVCLTEEYAEGYKENYNSWYYDEDEPMTYYDPEHIADMVSRACSLVYSLIDSEMYQDAMQLSGELLKLKIQVESEYNDEPFTVSDLYENELISGNYEELIYDMLYAAFLGSSPKERPEAIYHIMLQAQLDDISVDKMIRHSQNELPQMREFLSLWIPFLGQQSESMTESLLREATRMEIDENELIEAAKSCGQRHPCLYEELLSGEKISDEQRKMEIGLYALRDIPVEYSIRSDIALIVAEIAANRNEPETQDCCFAEAFRSDPDVTNFLRLALESSDYSRFQSEAQSIIQSYAPENCGFEVAFSSFRGELTKLHCGMMDYYGLSFLSGEYLRVYQETMFPEQGIGWSSTFVKCGMALFLLLLFEGQQLPPACERMSTHAAGYLSFDASDYCKGTGRKNTKSNENLFWEKFGQITNSEKLTPEQQENLIIHLLVLLDLRVNAIVSQQKRNYYGECAEMIAAIGEVMESRGQEGRKQQLLLEYKCRFPRHVAFIRELKSFGLK